MAKKSIKKTPKEPSKFSVQFKQLTTDTKEITGDPTTKIFGSLLLVMVGFFTAIAIISFYQNWTQDFSLSTTSLGEYTQPDYVGNIFGRLGNAIASLLILEGFGLAGLFVPLWIMLFGLKHAFTLNRIKPWVLFNHLLAATFLVALMFGWFANYQPTLLSGLSGYYIYLKLALYLGRMGVLLVLFTAWLLYVIVALKIRSLTFSWRSPKPLEETQRPSDDNLNSSSEITPEPKDDVLVPTVELSPEPEQAITPEPEIISRPTVAESTAQKKAPVDTASTLDVVVEVHQEALEDEKSINKKVKDFGEYDPTLDLSRFQLPKIELLQPYGDGKITFDKDKI